MAIWISSLALAPDVVEKVVAALIESIVFGVSPTNKPAVLNTIMRTFKITDIAAACAIAHEAGEG